MIIINNTIIENNSYPDGTQKIDFIVPDLEKITIEWYYENDTELFKVICLKRKIDEYDSSKKVSLYLPYLPNSRMDRVKNESDVFTLKYFCEVINSLNFERVICYDIHSSVGAALLKNCENRLPTNEINAVINSINDPNLVLCFPDEGAMKRYSDKLQRPYAFGVKKRNWETGKIEGLSLINDDKVVGKNVLIIDDICSYGGTFVYTAKALKAAGANNIHLYITHCENNILKGDVFKSNLFSSIYTMKTLPHCEELKIKIRYVG